MTDQTTEPVLSAEPAPDLGGRPSLYKPDYAEQVFKLCLLGATDIEIAGFFEVCEATINNWKLAYPEFKAQLRAGKMQADIHLASKLFNRAEGARWLEDVAQKVKVEHFDDRGKKIRTEERIEVVQIEKAAPPDTTALIFWLKNRDPRRWRDKQDLELSGANGGAIATTTAIVTGEELKALIREAEQDV